MYVPDHFAIQDRATQLGLVRDHNFGILISVIDDVPFATHLPFVVREQQEQVWLYAHMAKANPHWQHLDGEKILAVFTGPHGYISPTWYQSPGVPTWNYSAVHITGEAEILPGVEDRRELVKQLSEQHEAANPQPWQADYPESMLSAIVAFRIQAHRIEGKYKLSQNRPEQDQKGVLKALQQPFGQPPKDVHRELAALMRQYIKS